MSRRYAALIPLRGGSKSIPLKNIKVIAGRPLCYWTLAAAVGAGYCEEVIVSTDSAEIANVVKSLGLQIRVIARPDDLASDTASTESVMLHAMDFTRCDHLVTIQATSPLLTASDLAVGREQYERDGLDSLLSAVRTKRFFWSDAGIPLNYDPLKRPRRQDFAGTLMENGAFYITSRELLMAKRCRLGGRIGVFEMGEDAAAEIDEPADWALIERLLMARSELGAKL